jgi:hypothetical protein
MENLLLYPFSKLSDTAPTNIHYVRLLIFDAEIKLSNCVLFDVDLSCLLYHARQVKEFAILHLR